MKLNKHDKEYKKYLKLEAEYDKLWKMVHYAPYVEVEPYQDGWLVSYDLEDHVKKSPKYPDIKWAFDIKFRKFITNNVNLVRIIRRVKNFDDLCSKKEFRTMVPHGGYYASRNYRINEKTYFGLPPGRQRFFSKDPDTYDRFGLPYYNMDAFPNHFVILKARPYIVTQVKDVDGKIISKRDKVYQELQTLRRKFGHSFGKSFPAGKNRAQIRDKISKFLKNEIEEDQLTTDNFFEYEY